MIRSIKKSLKVQVWLLYSLIFIAIIAAGIVLLNGWSQNNLKVLETEGRVDESVEIAHIIDGHVNWVIELENSILNGTEFTGSYDPETCSFGEWQNNLNEDLKNDTEIAGAIANIEEPHAYIHSKAEEIIELSKTDTAAAMDEFQLEILPNFCTIVTNLTAISIRCNDLAMESTVASAETMGNNSIIQLAIIILVLILSVIIGLAISKLAINPTIKITKAAEKLASGDLNTNIEIKSQNEIGAMAAALNSAIGLFKSIIKDVDTVMQELSAGNLLVTTSSNYIGDFNSIQLSINMLAEKLSEVMGSIINAAAQVASGASLVSDSSIQLSQGSTEQASSVEELNAALEQVAEQTSSNATKARAANDLTVQVKNDAEKGNEQMSEMVKAMGDISVSSANIKKIIKVIDDIAFQTNILALNAAVEAARAGQHGKGFAVVAEEVRNLAGRSAQAAKETTEMIEGSINKVEAGTKIANETAGALEKIVEEVAKAAKLIDEITSASQEQAESIDEIGHGVSQVSEVVQNNAATAEESASTSEELSAQAALLEETISMFKLK